MGVDFLSKAGRSIERSMDRALRDLNTPDLFRRTPASPSRSVVAEMLPGVRLLKGEKLVVRCEREDVVVQRGITTVARVKNPSAELSSALKQTTARSGEVCNVLPFSDTAELKVD